GTRRVRHEPQERERARARRGQPPVHRGVDARPGEGTTAGASREPGLDVAPGHGAFHVVRHPLRGVRRVTWRRPGARRRIGAGLVLPGLLLWQPCEAAPEAPPAPTPPKRTAAKEPAKGASPKAQPAKKAQPRTQTAKAPPAKNPPLKNQPPKGNK